MRRIAVVTLLVCSLLSSRSVADTHTLDTEKSAALLKAAAEDGTKLKVESNVRDNVGVTAVMLTQKAVQRIFGKEIAKTYAVVQLTVSNRSPDMAFVIHSAYIDTSQWALGGGTRGFNGGESGPDPETYRAGSKPNRVASAEARIARGELLDAQQWSARNWTVRLLTVAGSLASGYTFAFHEKGIARGIAAFNGSFVPGVAFAWPDGTVAQLNRISDFGYQTNKVIGKDAGDIMVCFFPIDMFLSAPFKDTFLKSPGLFNSPYQILFTDANQDIRDLFDIPKGDELVKLRKLHACYSKMFEIPLQRPRKQKGGQKPPGTPDEPEPLSGVSKLFYEAQDEITKGCWEKLKKSPKELITLDYIGRFGLQNIGVYVDGIMTVNINTVPASIDDLTFTGDATKPDFWTVAGEKKGTFRCRFCQGGEVSILEADALGITDVAAIAEGSDDNNLKFSFKLTKAVETGKILTFVITKKSTDDKGVTKEAKSAPFAYTVAYVQVAPVITDVTIKDKKVTVTGSGFFNTTTNPLKVFLRSELSTDKDVPIELPAGQAGDKLTFDVPDLSPGCWTTHVNVNQMEAPVATKPSQKILSAADPKITEAKRGDSSISVKGTQLIDTSGCDGGKSLKFQLVKGTETQPVTRTLNSPTGATLSLPASAKTGDWKVQLLVDDKPVDPSVDLK